MLIVGSGTDPGWSEGSNKERFGLKNMEIRQI